MTHEASHSTSCVICFEDFGPNLEMARLPCCFTEESSMKCCMECIKILCQRGRGFGRCPTCRKYLYFKDGTLRVASNVAKCKLCLQIRTLSTNYSIISIAHGIICNLCNLGRQLRVRYECDRCHGLSLIPHPMWTYQDSMHAFSSDTWACRRCRTQTKWRIFAADVVKIPPQEIPERWGLITREQIFERIRKQRERNARQRSASFETLKLVFIGFILAFIARNIRNLSN
eukprot:maker-scaffold_7-snap-gene-19.72-mRNA-1 protein AED:0.01 eAED:0.00 QI:152/1/0.5/1/0.66/0.5/4/112/228